MPFTSASADGVVRGNLTDEERMRAQMGQSQAAINAQMQALQAEIADRQAGRAFQGNENASERTFRAGTQDKDLANRTAMSLEDTKRALGVVGAQMEPAKMGAQLDRDKFMVDAPRRALQAEVFKQMMPAMSGVGGGTAATGAPGTPQDVSQMPPGGVPMPSAPKFQMDPDMMMAMAFGGNPADVLAQRRQQTNADRAHTDAEDARNLEMGTKLIASGKPEAVALGTHFLSLVKNSGFAGQDPTTLKGALQPEVDAATAISQHPATQMKLDNVATLLKNAGTFSGSDAQIEQAKPLLTDLIKSLTDSGVKPEEAKAYVSMQLKKSLPANRTMADKIMHAIGGTLFLPAGIADVANVNARERNATARQVAGLVD